MRGEGEHVLVRAGGLGEGAETLLEGELGGGVGGGVAGERGLLGYCAEGEGKEEEGRGGSAQERSPVGREVSDVVLPEMGVKAKCGAGFRIVSMTLLDLCSYLGLGAAGAATVNLLLGLLIALRYSPVRQWPHRPVNVFALHQWTAYLTVALTLAHPVVLLWLKVPHFGWVDLLWPVHSPLQPWINSAGAAGLYLVVVLLGTSLLRLQIGRPLWRKLHYLAFPAMALIFVHSILTDPNLKDGHPDLLDGGKVFLEIACVLSVAAVVWRIVVRGRGLRTQGASKQESSGRSIRSLRG
jgi:hypothetical protein